MCKNLQAQQAASRPIERWTSVVSDGGQARAISRNNGAGTAPGYAGTRGGDETRAVAEADPFERRQTPQSGSARKQGVMRGWDVFLYFIEFYLVFII
jgi:hypothetical protein